MQIITGLLSTQQEHYNRPGAGVAFWAGVAATARALEAEGTITKEMADRLDAGACEIILNAESTSTG